MYQIAIRFPSSLGVYHEPTVESVRGRYIQILTQEDDNRRESGFPEADQSSEDVHLSRVLSGSLSDREDTPKDLTAISSALVGILTTYTANQILGRTWSTIKLLGICMTAYATLYAVFM